MPHRRLWRRLGRKGALVVLFGVMFTVYGLALCMPARSSQESLAAALWLAPLSVWSAAWMAVGITGIAAAVCRRLDVAFTVLVGLPLVWSLLGLGSWALLGADRAWVLAALFAPWSAALALCSGLLEPPPRVQ